MAQKKDEAFNEDYKNLRLHYAVENHEVKKLLDRWLKRHEKYSQMLGGEQKTYDKAMLHTSKLTEKTLDTLLTKLTALMLSYDSAAEIFYDYYRVVKKEKRDLRINYSVPTIVTKGKILPFECRSKKDHSKLVKIIKSGSFEKNEEWFMEKYKSFDFITRSMKEEKNLDDIYFFSDGRWVFNGQTGNFYWLEKQGYTFIEDVILENGRYLDLRIDLSKNTEDIKRQFETMIDLIKKPLDDFRLQGYNAMPKRKQNIDLYKRYLKVYRLVQEKGEKWTEIAKEVFPSEQADPDKKASALAKVHNYYKEAKRLIAEGLP